MRLSIIVPILNEVEQLPELFAHLLPYQRAGCEIIFVDGGSTDGSAMLTEVAGFTALRTTRGRANQMNVGAAQASGDVLLFLHADSRLPQGAARHIEQALANKVHCWGRFDVCITGRPFMLRVVARLMNWRSRLTGIATGDQAIFVRRDMFAHLRGFPDQPLMEDVELSKRLLTLSRPACIAHCVTTSGRRWETRGVWRTILLMWRLRWAYWRGMDASELVKLYR
ncbi:Transferase 2, rSAM/selenodomain-associated [Candidatus Nitrotoga sp. BS]|uniref:TIGR04283 family arsenosugar biosynthesis glycosyltransferase n=1 Tax=Candidatus Nitrotoga sp. BS TaxID=2890408 RepID=UPI001EF217A2|nr:TIGR04283 family arsenosugar biosynthesis glycosyltransferase [Candidatus Nitrotoga sp. BS]CAH1198629.1 Transferase 2, rSAM/selenodomain-associated [Candidatus Nitrotoga sp. BS]